MPDTTTSASKRVGSGVKHAEQANGHTPEFSVTTQPEPGSAWETFKLKASDPKLVFCLFVVGFVWILTPFSWYIVFRTFYRMAYQGAAFSDCVPGGSYVRVPYLTPIWTGLKRIIYFHAFLEVPFSIYLRYLMIKAGAKRVPPPVEPEILETLLATCLEVGLPNADGSPPKKGKERVRSINGRLPPKRVSDNFEGKVVTSESARVVREKMMRWFLGAKPEDLRADNVRQWLAWAFLGRELEETKDVPRIKQLVEESLEMLQRRIRYTFPEGYNPAVKSIRLTLDPLSINQRPIGHYIVTNGVSAAVIAYNCAFKGFKRVTYGACDFLIKPDTRKNKSDGALPILFLHGLGIGLGQYIPFLHRLSKHEAGVVIMIQPNISGTIHSKGFLDAPSEAEHVEAIKLAMDGEGFKEATVVSHSK